MIAEPARPMLAAGPVTQRPKRRGGRPRPPARAADYALGISHRNLRTIQSGCSPDHSAARSCDCHTHCGVAVIAAFYVPRAAPVPDPELAAHCSGLLARYKCPRAFHAVNALPRGANGKLLRRQLKEARP